VVKNRNLTLVGALWDVTQCLGWSSSPEAVGETYRYFASFNYLWFYILFFWTLTIRKTSKDVFIILSSAVFACIVLSIGLLTGRLWIGSSALYLIMGYFFHFCTPIQFQFNFKWYTFIYGLILVNLFFCQIPFLAPQLLNKIIVYFPLILTATEIIFSKVMELGFATHRHNQLAMSFLMILFLYFGEAVRFGSFLALYIGWRHGLKEFSDVAWSIVFSIIGELFSHSGIREVAQEWLRKNISFLKKLDSFPEVRYNMSSIRQVLEWVLPINVVSYLFVLNQTRRCMPVSNVDIINQIIFFTSKTLFKDVWEVLLCYYCTEFIAMLLCKFVGRYTSFKEISAFGSLKTSGIVTLTLTVFLASLWADLLYYIPMVMGYSY